MSSKIYDVIVCGLGGNGSLAIEKLSALGLSVLGLERQQLEMAGVGSQGETRLLRRSYYEESRYIPLISQSLDAFRKIQETTPQKLLTETPLLFIGPKSHPLLERSYECLTLHGLPASNLNASTCETRFPYLTLGADDRAVLEEQACILFPEKIMAHCLSRARKQGAMIEEGCEIKSISFTEDSVVVESSKGRFRAAKVLITVGGWIQQILPKAKVPIEIREGPAFWFRENTGQSKLSVPFVATLGDETVYGFPDQGNGIKIGSYRSGRHLATPDDRDPTSVFGLVEIQQAIRKYFPHVFPVPIASRTCFYDMGPGENLIVDFHPDDHRLAIIAGGSGHGYKMAPALVASAIDRLLNGSVSEEMKFLELSFK